MVKSFVLMIGALPAAARLAMPLLVALILAGCFSVKPDSSGSPGGSRPTTITITVKDDWGEGMGGVPVRVGGQVARTRSNGSVVVGVEHLPVVVMPSGDGHSYNPSQVTLTSSRNITFTTLHPIVDSPAVTRAQAKAWLRGELQRRGHNQASVMNYVGLVDHYYDIAPVYGIRPEVALAQAAHETNYFRFGGIVEPWQNNFAGIGATGAVSDGTTPLRGADPNQVSFRKGVHGAIFSTPAAGVEAQIQHLYAYASSKPLPAGRKLLSPRFTLVTRGSAPNVEWLGKNQNPSGIGWATDAKYGQKIIQNFLIPMQQAAGS